MPEKKIKIGLAWQMVIGMVIGVIVGALVTKDFAATWLQPLGDLFIRLIRMVVVPLVLATLIARSWVALQSRFCWSTWWVRQSL